MNKGQWFTICLILAMGATYVAIIERSMSSIKNHEACVQENYGQEDSCSNKRQ